MSLDPPVAAQAGDNLRITEILTVQEVASELRCSKAHVCNVVNGRVKNTPRLPVIRLGRRTLIRRSTLEIWKRASELGVEINDIMPQSEVSAVDA